MSTGYRLLSIAVAAAVASMCDPVFGAERDCTAESARMGSIQTNMLHCLNKGLSGSELIRKGRSEPRGSPLVKEGYAKCQAGLPGYDHAEICDAASFWVAARSVLPERAPATIDVHAGNMYWQGPLVIPPGANQLSVSGTWTSDPQRPGHGPCGNGTKAEGKRYPKEDGVAQQGALLWQRGQTIEAWCGAASSPPLVDGPASLFFKMNDASYGDNSGLLTVTSTPK
jgi:hypothetical protein